MNPFWRRKRPPPKARGADGRAAGSLPRLTLRSVSEIRGREGPDDRQRGDAATDAAAASETSVAPPADAREHALVVQDRPPSFNPHSAIKTPALCTRQTAPQMRPTARGARGEQGLLDEREKATLRDNIDDLRHAASAASSRDSLLSTWEFFLRRWHGLDKPAVPVDPADIGNVGSLMRVGGYRSFANYVSRVKEMHIRAGYDWTQLHALESAQICRAVTRGIGPPKQSAEIPLPTVLALMRGPEPPQARGGQPLHAARLFLLGSMFMLRELETACARTSHVTVDREAKVVHWLVPTSKVDVNGLGISLRWGCLCGTPAGDVPCAFHLMLAQLEALQQDFPEGCADMPLFPDARGGNPEKADVVSAFDLLAHSANLPLQDNMGRPRFGGHSMRISGSRWLAGIGIEIKKIQVMARWDSDVVLHYIKTAPMASVTEDVRAKLGGTQGHDCDKLLAICDNPGADMLEVLPRLKAIEDRLSASERDALVANLGDVTHEERIAAVEAVVEALKLKSQGQDNLFKAAQSDLKELKHLILDPVVINAKSQVAHRALNGRAGIPSRSRCGWIFDGAPHSRVCEVPNTHPSTLVCERCLPDVRAERVERERQWGMPSTERTATGAE